MSGYDYDLFVVGAGSGGVRAARIAAGYGARVAVAEEYRVGGTCVIRGCVPKKLMVYAAMFGEAFEDARGFGWEVGEARFDWSRFIAAKDAEIARLEGIYRTNLDKAGVTILASRATLRGPHTVALSDGKTVTAATILIATGAAPHLDSTIDGIEHAVSSNEMFHLQRLPERIAIIGGGYIAVEFAGVMAGLGAKTHLIYRGDKILRGFDGDIRNHLMSEYGKRGIDLRMQTGIRSIAKADDGLILSFLDGSSLTVDQVLMATGRRPNTAGLGLAEAGVALDDAGGVVVDALSRTSVPSIYAVGDVTNRLQLTPIAIREGHAFADTVFGNRETSADQRLTPTAVFSEPEIGTVGLTQEEAHREGYALDIYRTTFRPMKHTLSGRDTRMLMKLVVDADTARVLGVHLCGPDAAEMIQILGIAVKMGATKADFDATVAVHPTAAEELVTMRTRSEHIPRA